MISLTMLGIIALITTGALFTSVRTVTSGERKIDRLERTRTSFNMIDSQVQSQVPLSFVENGEKKYYFQGDKEYLQFPTNYSIWGGRNGYILVKYNVQSDNTGKKFLSVSENIIGGSVLRESHLFSSADVIYFEYFFKDPTEGKGGWGDKWTDTAHIPQKIRLHLAYGEKEISLIIPTRTESPSTLTALVAPAGKPAQPSKTGRQGQQVKGAK
jgi:hypothetical protein